MLLYNVQHILGPFFLSLEMVHILYLNQLWNLFKTDDAVSVEIVSILPL